MLGVKVELHAPDRQTHDMRNPMCPECGKPMVQRVAQKGPMAGNEFFGCSGFPKCRQTQPLESSETEPTDSPEAKDVSSQPQHVAAPAKSRRREQTSSTIKGAIDSSIKALSRDRSILWQDGTLRRPGWKCHHVTMSGTFRSLPHQVPEATATAFIARRDVPLSSPLTEESRRVIEIWNKLLLRGMAPPVHPVSERQMLEASGFGPKDFLASRYLGDLAPRVARPYSLLAQFRDRQDRDLDDVFDSDAENSFATWLAKSAPHLIPFLTPQASFDGVLLSRGYRNEISGCRRVDFLLLAPGSTPIVVEIDGAHHDGQKLTDAQRDALLASVGVTTIRVSTLELRQGIGPQLSRVLDVGTSVAVSNHVDPLAWAPVLLHRFAYALGEAVSAGFLAGDNWSIHLEDPTGLIATSCGPYFQALRALDILWGQQHLAPTRVNIRAGDESLSYVLHEDGRYQLELGAFIAPDVHIDLDMDNAPCESLPLVEDAPSIIIRTACIGARVSRFPTSGATRVASNSEPSAIDPCLVDLLQLVFAKESFRPGQIEAVREVLGGGDCCVLLPTGAGKSIIYQLAGLLMPGRTLIIDPIVSLIEDQVRGLHAHGIDRAVGITSFTTKQGETGRILKQIADADSYFVFLAPERLQMSEFRQAVKGLTVATPINLGVIDEAHCVSEWGHDFRTSYLGLGNVIRNIAADPRGKPPPLLALTGTASRAVLRDVLFQLDIREETENSIIRPATFDRKELSYRVQETKPVDQESVLAAVLKSLPGAFNETLQTFYLPDGESTYSGLVFVPTVNGNRNGLLKTKEIVSGVCGSVEMYSGSPPKEHSKDLWETTKRANADSFKDNQVTSLVSTNAFGMGIDKPNIRWVIHYGLPSSIESFYQEVGRAGRDGRLAHCVLILSEFDPRRNSELLSEDLSLEEARVRQQNLSWNQRDDITTALYFHVNSFPGIRDEHASLDEMVRTLDPTTQRQSITIPFDHDNKRQERALHRLKILGVVSDYLKEYGSQQYEVTTETSDPSVVKRNLVEFVGRTQPGRVQEMSSRVDAINLGNHETVTRCARLLIEFVYETVERSRRRSLREMLLAARQGKTDNELRQRVLNYLSEGDVGRIIETLVESTKVDLNGWISYWSKIGNRTDAAEWRASAARLLTSFPDHPGLLFTRALGEILDTDDGPLKADSVEEYASNFESALQTAGPLYRLSAEEITRTIEWLARRVAIRSDVVGALTISIAERYDAVSPGLFKWLSELAREDVGAAIIDLDRNLIEAFHLVDTVLKRAQGES